MKDAWISFIAGAIQILFSLYYFFSAFRVSRIFQELNAPQPHPILQNWPGMIFLFFGVANFYFGSVRKKRSREEKAIKYASLMSVLLMILPFVVMYIVGSFSSMKVLKLLQEAGVY